MFTDTDFGTTSREPSWSPDGALSAYTGGLLYIRRDGTLLAWAGVAGLRPDWSPDGTRLSYSRDRRRDTEISSRAATAPVDDAAHRTTRSPI